MRLQLGLQKGGGLYLALGTRFVMSLQKRIVGHMEVETKKFISKAKQRKDRNKHTAQTWVQAYLITGTMSVLTSGVFMVGKKKKRGLWVWLKLS
jgi:hypothetical protein